MNASPLRLVMISRQFWPRVGGAEVMMGHLSAALAAGGAEVTLLTARWHRQWPGEITRRGVRIVRLPQPAMRFWGTLRYMMALSRWLKRERSGYDAVLVSMLKHDAAAAVAAAASHVPVILRAEGSGREGDCVWQIEATAGARIKRHCLSADAIVAPSKAIQRELLAAGYPGERVHYIANGVAVPRPPALGDKAAARKSLADSSPLLSCPAGVPLAVYTGRLAEAKGLKELVAAWAAVVKRWPAARLWLLGSGPLEADLQREIASRNLSGQVILPGEFDNVDELLRAADVYVFPSWSEGMSLALLEAMAAALPIVATDVPGNRALVAPGEHALLVPTQDPAALAEAVGKLLDDRTAAEAMGQRARSRVELHFSLDQSAEHHRQLIQRTIAAKQGPRPS